MLLAILLLSPATLLADEVESFENAESVALPGQSAYMDRGISIGLAAGVFSPVEECDCMGMWQAQLEYFYSDWVSGGLEARFFGGDLDDASMVMYQRYRLNVRFHRVREGKDFFVGPVLGFESTNIAEFRRQVRGKPTKTKYWWQKDVVEDEDGDGDNDSLLESDVCKKLFSLDGFTLGLGMGGGYNLSRLFSVTALLQMEYNLSKDVMFSFAPGLAFNLHEVWPWARRTLRSAWISFEVGGHRSFNRDVDGWSNTFILGIQLGV